MATKPTTGTRKRKQRSTASSPPVACKSRKTAAATAPSTVTPKGPSTPVKVLHPVNLLSSKDLAARMAFMHGFGGFAQGSLSTVCGFDVYTLYPITRRLKKRLDKYPRDPTKDELAEVDRIREAFQDLAGKPTSPLPPPPPVTASGTLQFPMPNESRVHLNKLVSLVSETTTSIAIYMYVFSLEELVEAVITVNARLSAGAHDTPVRIILDYQQMHSSLRVVRALLAAKIPVKVHKRTTFMMHSKFTLFDTYKVTYGSFNWSRHALASKGHLTIEDDESERQQSYRNDFEDMWAPSSEFMFVTLELLDDMEEITCSLCNATLRAVRAEVKEQLKEAAKQIAAAIAQRCQLQQGRSW